jgi:FkbM family methyltransferase
MEGSATMKLALLKAANALLKPFGAELYRAGIGMDSVLQQIASWNPEFKTVVDLGCARAYWARSALNYFPNARVFGVEPLVEREPFLAKLKAANSRFDYVLAVAGSGEGEVELAVTPDLDGSTVAGAEGPRRSVPMHSLDGLAASRGLEGPFFVKFDTHGFEMPIIEGGTNMLAQAEYILMECYNFRHTENTVLFHDMIDVMAEKGFRVFNLVEPLQRPTDGALWQMDLFFAREEHPVFRSNSFRR